MRKQPARPVGRKDRRLTLFAWAAVIISALWLAFSPGGRRVQGRVTPSYPVIAGEPLWQTAHRVSRAFGEEHPWGITYLRTRDPETQRPIANVQMGGTFNHPAAQGPPGAAGVDRLVFNLLLDSGRVIEVRGLRLQEAVWRLAWRPEKPWDPLTEPPAPLKGPNAVTSQK